MPAANLAARRSRGELGGAGTSQRRVQVDDLAEAIHSP
jgi:hypothetical protein